MPDANQRDRISAVMETAKRFILNRQVRQERQGNAGNSGTLIIANFR